MAFSTLDRAALQGSVVPDDFDVPEYFSGAEGRFPSSIQKLSFLDLLTNKIGARLGKYV
jgi:hypothetical protein